MGFSLKKVFKKAVKFTDKLGFGHLLEAAGLPTLSSALYPGEGPDLEGVKDEEEAKEKIRLWEEEKQRREEAKFMSEEGKGLRRTSDLSFGSDDAIKASGTESQRATGRTDEPRLVL